MCMCMCIRMCMCRCVCVYTCSSECKRVRMCMDDQAIREAHLPSSSRWQLSRLRASFPFTSLFVSAASHASGPILDNALDLHLSTMLSSFSRTLSDCWCGGGVGVGGGGKNAVNRNEHTSIDTSPKQFDTQQRQNPRCVVSSIYPEHPEPRTDWTSEFT